MSEEGLKQKMERIRDEHSGSIGMRHHAKHFLTALEKTIAEIKAMRFECNGCGERMFFTGNISKDHPHYSFIRDDVLKALDSEEGKE